MTIHQQEHSRCVTVDSKTFESAGMSWLYNIKLRLYFSHW